MSEANHLDGWRIVSDCENGSLLVESPQGHRKRIWRDLIEDQNQELLQQVAELMAENVRLRGELEEAVDELVCDGGIHDWTPNAAGQPVSLEPSVAELAAQRMRELRSGKAEIERLRAEIERLTKLCRDLVWLDSEEVSDE